MQHAEAVGIAQKIYQYYYFHAIKEFDHGTSASLAQIPADYVYNSLLRQESCYIDSECCLEYCYERLDSDFNRMDPDIKRKVYEKAFGVQAGNVSDSEIDMRLKSKRRQKTNELYYSRFNTLKENNENDFAESFKGLSVKRNRTESIDRVLKKLNLM
jgi:hypothetical protein